MTIQNRIQQWIDTGYARYAGAPIPKGKGWMDWNEYSLNDIFFGPSNYREVMLDDGQDEDLSVFFQRYLDDYSDDAINISTYHQIQCLLSINRGGTIEEYLDRVLGQDAT